MSLSRRNSMGGQAMAEDKQHQLSPTSWNRFEECPRKYWLSKQGLPRKAGMAASLGTAIHNSVEDLCNLDLDGRDDEEVGWLPEAVKEAMDRNWEAEREVFLATPRHPRWKEDRLPKARAGLAGALSILMSRTNAAERSLPKVSVGVWRQVQQRVLATESNLVSDCGRLTGRLDLLLSEPDEQGKERWIVADLKTGNPPESSLDEKVDRQLRLYRDILKQSKPEHPPVQAEGWYSADQSVHRTDGPPILDAAIEAWGLMTPTEDPPAATPSEAACAFCDWKAWCPSWWVARMEGEIIPHGSFSDEVVRLVRLEAATGAALFERTPPVGVDGELSGSQHRFGALLADSALDSIREIAESGNDGPLFLGSAMVSSSTMRLGHWSEVMPWSPLLRSLR